MSGETNQNATPGNVSAQAGNGIIAAMPLEPASQRAGGGQVVQDELEARLVILDKEKNETWDRYLRTAADLENLRKRQKREMDEARLESKSLVLKEILPVVDSLERAIEHALVQDGTLSTEGVQLVLRQFLTALERLDVSPIEAAGQLFNPSLHEAISQQASNAQPGTVVQVLQRGYKSGDRLLRPALVVVAK